MVQLWEIKILVVDDNQELLQMLENILRQEGYQYVYTATDCKSAKKVFQQMRSEFMILDVNLPDGNGFSLFQELRKDEDVPALFLSARDEDQDRLFGLGLGADDYITKPFLTRELLLRIQLILKRTYAPKVQKQQEDILMLGKTSISFASASVMKDGVETILTATELTILKKLYENRGNIVTFDTICQAVWQEGYYGYENSLMVHMRHLREKIEEVPSEPQWIITVRGLGYKMAKDS